MQKNVMRHWAAAITIASIALIFSATVYPAAADEPSAGALFRQVQDHFLNMNTMSYSVKRAIVNSKLNAEDRWVFRFKKPDLVRIDYQAPHERVIIFDGSTLWEYIPQLKKAAKTNVAGMPKEKQAKIIADVMAHVAVEGLHLGDYGEMEKRASVVKTSSSLGRDVYVVEGKGPRYAVYIDKEKKALLKTELYDQKGSLTLRTVGSRFIDAGKGFWLPQEIRSTCRTGNGFVQTTVTLHEIRIDAPISDEMFRFEVPKGIAVILN